jgi:hypothetical protein
MAGSDEAPETTEWRRASKFYRRPPGLPWLIGLVVIPLLLGVIGYGEVNRNRSIADVERAVRSVECAGDSCVVVGAVVNHSQRQQHHASW